MGIDLHTAFNYIRLKRPVTYLSNAQFKRLLKYETAILGKASFKMIKINQENVTIEVPDFFQTEHSELIRLEILKNKLK